MSELSERVAREHVHDASLGKCTCGELFEIATLADERQEHTAHLIDVTEAAVRETIAADIEKAKYRYGRDRQIAMLAAAKIARGEP